MSRRRRSSSRPRSPPIRSASAAISGRGRSAGHAQPDDQRRRQRAGPQPPLLPAAGKQRRQPHPRPAADEQRPDALGPYNLCPLTDARSTFQRGQIERDFPCRLRQVGVKQRPGRLRDRRQPGNILDHAGLVVHRHDADQQRRHGQRLAQHVRIEQPVARTGRTTGSNPSAARSRHGFQDALMFCDDSDDAAPRIRPARRQSARRP